MVVSGFDRPCSFPPFQVFRQLNPGTFVLERRPVREVEFDPQVAFLCIDVANCGDYIWSIGNAIAHQSG
jgi:hypothetical protein